MRLSRPLKSILLAVAGIGLFSCAHRMSARPTERTGSYAMPVAPPRGSGSPAPLRSATGPRMNHAKHLGKGLECADCHLKGAEGEKIVEPRTITYAACAECHDEEDAKQPEKDRVKSVFFKPDGAPAWESTLTRLDKEVKWSHAPHQKVDCAECHKTLDEKPRLVHPVPSMSSCMACHAQKSAPNRCDTCHNVLRDNVAPPSHATGWRRGHGAAAQSSGARCETCHRDPATCDRCHQRTEPASHDANWVSSHGAAALARAERCEMCHVDPQGCVRCHLVTQPASHHHLWKERHGAAALSARGRREGRCEMCHLDPNFCEHCHAIEPPRDHTNLFRTRTHGVLASIDRTKCQVCHETDFCIRCHQDTPPRSHGPLWASGPNLHCVQCHLPVASEHNCRACHFSEPTHDTAPDQPAWHVPGMNCRLCHTPAGNGAPPLKHLDNGTQCTVCHH